MNANDGKNLRLLLDVILSEINVLGILDIKDIRERNIKNAKELIYLETTTRDLHYKEEIRSQDKTRLYIKNLAKNKIEQMHKIILPGIYSDCLREFENNLADIINVLENHIRDYVLRKLELDLQNFLQDALRETKKND